jgi:hypothetical protein
MLPIIGLIITLVLLIIVFTWRLFTNVNPDDTLGTWYEGGRSGERITADKYQRQVLSDYKHLRPSKNRIPYSEFCYPRKFKVQPQQQLAGDYMRPSNISHGSDSLLVIHKIGAGKTCLSIQIGLKWLKKGKPLYVMPASLIPGFRGELRSPCAGNTYLTAEERAELQQLTPGSPEHSSIIAKSDARINRDFTIMSYNKFAELAGKNMSKLDAPILIVDELQNINTPGGKYYGAVKKWTERFTSPIVLMSATPLFDSTDEIHGIATLMRIEPPDGGKWGGISDRGGLNVITPDDIKKLFAGKVSYFEGAPDYTFPDVMVKVKKCPMSQHQAKWYHATVEAEMKKSGDIRLREVADSFYIKSRQRSNVVYPKGLTGQTGLNLLTDGIIRSSLDTYSAKYAVLTRKLLRSHGPESLSFVYTGFTGAGGIAALTKCLRAVGYKNYLTDGPGKRRYVVWSGEETLREKAIIKDVFNSPANDDASQIQVVIGSSAIKEGVSLMRVRTVHVLETYWNHSRLDQIIGRAVRYCSHKSLPARDRSVLVYIYASTAGKLSKLPTPMESIDLYMLDIADKKRDDIEPYMEAFATVAIDKFVHYPE